MEHRAGSASFTPFGIPNQEEMRTDYAIKIPMPSASSPPFPGRSR